jgi:hypothetical protein
MKDLEAHREGWEEMQRVEDALTSTLTPQSGVRQFKELWRQFAPLLERTEALYHEGRQHHLATLQARLLCLIERKKL